MGKIFNSLDKVKHSPAFPAVVWAVECNGNDWRCENSPVVWWMESSCLDKAAISVIMGKGERKIHGGTMN